MSDIIKESADYIRKRLNATRRPGRPNKLDHQDEIRGFTGWAARGS